jgi:transcription factor E
MFNISDMAFMDEAVGSVLCETLGGESVDVIRVIDTPMEDKEISKELKFETSKVRTILNELLVKNLVTLNRDRQDTGYCYYRWVRREDKIKEYVNEYVDGRIRELDSQLTDSEDIMFECGCRKIGYGEAIEMGFACPTCGKTFSPAQTVKGSRRIKEELRKLAALKDAS